MNRLIATYKGHYKALFYLGLPIVIGQMGVIVLGFADTLMVGHHSTAELADAYYDCRLFLCGIHGTTRGTDSLDKTLFSGSTCIPGICHAVQWL